ncbi:MAG: glycosyltransferase family 4 protein [Verrucomicrobiota bacterium]
MKIAFLSTDNREQLSQYDKERPFFGPAPAALLDGFAMLGDEVEIHVISCTKRKMEAPEKLAENIWFHQPVVPKIGWGRTAFLGCAMAVRDILGEIRPDLVHAQGTERDCGVAMMLAPKGPRLLTIHGHMARIAEITHAKFPSYYWMASRLEAMAVRKADGVVALSNYTRERLKDHCRKSWVLPNALDTSFFGVNSPATGNIALCVGAVTPWKRQLELIQALDECPAGRRPRVVFLGSLGNDSYGQQVKAAIDQRDWCDYQGFADRRTLREWLSKAALLILPSIEDNCPMVILEAMAAGVPVAGSHIGGIPDLVEEGVTGTLFDPQIPTDMAGKIGELMGAPELRAACASLSAARALERYSPEVIARRHLEIYREVISNN